MLIYNWVLLVYVKSKSYWQDIDVLFLQIDNLCNIICCNIQEQRMIIKELFIEVDVIQVGVVEFDWQWVIKLVVCLLEVKGFILMEYSQVVIDNILNYGVYYVFDEGIVIFYVCFECGVRCNCFSLVVLEKFIFFVDSEKVDIVIMFGVWDSNVYIEEGICFIVVLLDNNDIMVKLWMVCSWEEVVVLL